MFAATHSIWLSMLAMSQAMSQARSTALSVITTATLSLLQLHYYCDEYSNISSNICIEYSNIKLFVSLRQ